MSAPEVAPSTTDASGSRPPPFGLYIHFPFCKSRCPYCAFYFVVGREEKRTAAVDALVREITDRAHDPRFAGRRVSSVYFGGGTPSLLPAKDVARILDTARAAFEIEVGAEISLESNPDGLDLGALQALRAAGVNRLTLGWQSLDDILLKTLGRGNRRADNLAAWDAAAEAGFANRAVDLIFGVPGQSLEDWERTLEETARLAPAHVSAYELTLEEGTKFVAMHREGALILPDEEARVAMFEATDAILAPAGVLRYEVSNFARTGFECRHNVSGWRSGDLLGAGASAASHVANARWTNVADLDDYILRAGAGEDVSLPAEILGEETWAAEDLYLGLRLVDGIDAEERLSRVEGAGGARLRAVLGRAVSEGLLHREGGRVKLTRRGLLFADTLFEELLTPPA